MTESLLNVNLDDDKEFRTLADNSEAQCTISRAEVSESKSYSDRNNLRLALDCGEDDVDDIMVWVPIPNDDWKNADPKGYQKGVNRFKKMCQCFGITLPIETEALGGLSGWVLVSEEEDDRNPGKFRNSVRDFIVQGG